MIEDWTLEELVERVGQTLAAIDVRAPNGRVTGLPDARVIRWYATIGLVDKPSGMRGRTALYGQRHLLQLVAVKRRQAEGRPLAEIQAELAGATDAALTRIAAMPASAGIVAPTMESHAVPDPEPGRGRFWAERPMVEDGLRHAVTLGGAVLVLPTTITHADAAAIRAAAQPLIDLLRHRGITEEGAQ